MLYQGAAKNMSSQSGARLVKSRKIVVRALRPRQVAICREAMSAIAHMPLDRIADPQHADLVAGFVGPYPGLVMSPLMGVPFSDTVELDQWATTINEIGNHSRYDDRIPVIEAAWQSTEDYLAQLLGAPNVVELNEDGKSRVLQEEIDPAFAEEARTAELLCPEEAFTIIE